MNIQYIRSGDYFIPNLTLQEENRPIGKWGRMRRDYLKEYKPIKAYGDVNRIDDDQIKADFGELYRLLNGMPLQEMDWIINPVCVLCQDRWVRVRRFDFEAKQAVL